MTKNDLHGRRTSGFGSKVWHGPDEGIGPFDIDDVTDRRHVKFGGDTGEESLPESARSGDDVGEFELILSRDYERRQALGEKAFQRGSIGDEHFGHTWQFGGFRSSLEIGGKAWKRPKLGRNSQNSWSTFWSRERHHLAKDVRAAGVARFAYRTTLNKNNHPVVKGGDLEEKDSSHERWTCSSPSPAPRRSDPVRTWSLRIQGCGPPSSPTVQPTSSSSFFSTKLQARPSDDMVNKLAYHISLN
ncbi:unnamed protein product [Nesidiocoris tenuis]|uniref:Uncharacterized protein n=1 Tax=Nesidiocoris tenuis TaxID=355587 RepID=A0A6H5G1R1_9HEMI|nr:unnamed protein product [Nesidiocoris tenuis]